MKELLDTVKRKLAVDRKLLLTYVLVYISAGFIMDKVGASMEIARFTYWWQVLTVYGLYMIPISLVLRGMPFHRQYAYGLIAMGILEFGGYALESSYAYPDNILDRLFNIRNFSLGMALFFAVYFPLGNALVQFIYKSVFKSE